MGVTLVQPFALPYFSIDMACFFAIPSWQVECHPLYGRLHNRSFFRFGFLFFLLLRSGKKSILEIILTKPKNRRILRVLQLRFRLIAYPAVEKQIFIPLAVNFYNPGMAVNIQAEIHT